MDSINSDDRPFCSIDTSIGQVYLFHVRGQELLSLERTFGNRLDYLESEDFFKLYLPFFVYLKEDLMGEGLERPRTFTLSVEEVNQLTDKELEEIARLFVEEHTYLYHAVKRGQHERDAGIPVFKSYGDIDTALLKRPDESYIEYLHRLLVERQKKDYSESRELFSSFSLKLSEDIIKTMHMGETLAHSYHHPGSMRTESTPAEGEKETVPLKELTMKIDLLAEAQRGSAAYAGSVYKTQMQAAKELKSTCDRAEVYASEGSKYARSNIRYSKVIILLVLLSIVATALGFVYQEWFGADTHERDQKFQQHENLTGEKLQKITSALNEQNIIREHTKSSIVETNAKLEHLTKVLKEQNKLQNEQLQKLQDEIAALKSAPSKTLKEKRKVRKKRTYRRYNQGRNILSRS